MRRGLFWLGILAGGWVERFSVICRGNGICGDWEVGGMSEELMGIYRSG